MSKKFDDPVVAKIHAVRAAMLEAAGGDIRLLMQQVAERQRESHRRVITQPIGKSADHDDACERQKV